MLLLLLFLVSAAQAGEPWITASNRIALEYAEADGELFPERASSLGLQRFDPFMMQIDREGPAREREFLQAWERRLGDELLRAEGRELRLDLGILRDHLRLRLEEIRLEEKHGVVSFTPATRLVMQSLRQLLQEQSPAARKTAAIGRFHRYVRGDGERPPLLSALKNRTLSDQLRFSKKQLPPLAAELSQYLAESPKFVEGVRELLASSGQKGWEEDFALFQKQAESYDRFAESLLPGARKGFRLPRDIYAHTLRMRGIESSPEELIRRARARYRSLFREFREKAREVARLEKTSVAEPAALIARLKRKQILEPAAVKALFESADRQLAAILEREKLVTLPKAPLRIRVAGEAESLANPVPHLNDVPLIGNQGERPEFVVPSFRSGQGLIDDFSYEAAALVLTAHEGRPGHDLQFSSILDRGTSVIRARYAFNNANAEGWGLYAEQMVYPYLPPAAQLVALQSRLIRVARAFLDPELQLGKIAPAEVPRLLTRELGLSERLAALELRRYQYDNPGQAPSYFFGLESMERARERVLGAFPGRYTEQCFHDGVLELGLLPVRLLGEQLEKSWKCTGNARSRASVGSPEERSPKSLKTF